MNVPADAAEPARATSIGLVGLGLVGRALGERLAAAGHALVGHDRDPAASAAWAGPGRRVVSSPAAVAAACHAVVLAVFNTEGGCGPSACRRHRRCGTAAGATRRSKLPAPRTR